MRKIACMLASAQSNDRARAFFAPHQLAIATKGAIEIGSHAVARAWDQNRNNPEFGVLSVDGTNGFNMSSRANFCDRTREHFPHIARLAYYLYAGAAWLIYGSWVIYSTTGNHQGCPLGAFLFCLGIHRLVVALNAIGVLNVWYSDNGYIGGNAQQLARAWAAIKAEHAISGYVAAPERAQILSRGSMLLPPSPEDDAMEIDEDHLSSVLIGEFNRLERVPNMIVLGRPVGEDQFVRSILDEKFTDLSFILTVLEGLTDSQAAFYLMRQCVVPSRIMHLMRLLPRESVNELLERFDHRVCSALSTLLGMDDDLPEHAWRQAQLKLSLGGLGLMSASLNADAARISAVSLIAPTVSQLLGIDLGNGESFDATLIDGNVEAAVERYNTQRAGDSLVPITPLDVHTLPLALKQERMVMDLQIGQRSRLLKVRERVEIEGEIVNIRSGGQHAADREVSIEIRQNEINAINQNSARIISAGGPGASAWLVALPNSSCQTQMSPDQFQLAARYRLGCLPFGHNCKYCNKIIDSNNVESSICKFSGYRFSRHNGDVAVLEKLAKLAGYQSSLEDNGLFGGPDRRRRPDLTLANYNGRRALTVDLSVTCAAALSYAKKAGTVPLFAASERDKQKRRKYGAICAAANLDFLPFSIETFGAISKLAYAFVKKLVKRAVMRDSNADERAFNVQLRHFLQRLSVAHQAANADMIRDCSDPRSVGPIQLPDPVMLPTDDADPERVD